jgi:phosphate starvation-inducible protein PhoH
MAVMNLRLTKLYVNLKMIINVCILQFALPKEIKSIQDES